METGFKGTFVISWPQTKVDGLAQAPVADLSVGATWSWQGDAVRVDGPSELLRLEQTSDETNLRRRAARMVHRLVGAAVSETSDLDAVEGLDGLRDNSFVVTDGSRSYTVTLIDIGNGAQPLLMFVDQLPPKNHDLWVVHQSFEPARQSAEGPDAGGVICFTPGTRINTSDGPRAIETLRQGDLVLTKDNGEQEIQWIGQRRMSGARLFAMPRLRPIRFRSGSLGIERPDEELVVSPEHRMLVKGAVARALFNTDEVLVRAKDMLNDHNVVIDSQLKEVTYVHLLLPKHQIVWANGVETESFHPANTALSTLSDEDRETLLAMRPDFEVQPERYGAFARRNLSASEAAILNHEAA
ncbi:Hint domain-containing protein [Lentibacter sp. XHP0401]|jgi:Hint domain|uniref:Hint domain-containing protein n=1 Tax=Lentibacter sp. XHP0401 TaxID=2984334 RepID=UPI0021E7B4E1|nr:Hint domain-containing protein [Lentibacter sp. XHP0401]MCV2893076.1 Hint domain-containing protein [Lentibacter sp. XHP0401]